MPVHEQPTSAQRMQQSATIQSAFTGCYNWRTVWRHTVTANAYGFSQRHQAHAEGRESSQASAEGLSPMDVENALELYRAIIKEQLHERSSLTRRLAHSYLSKTGPLISEETQRQAQRNVSFRARLLEEEGAETYESLAVLRGRSQSRSEEHTSELQ